MHNFLFPSVSSLPTSGLTLTATATEQASLLFNSGKNPYGFTTVFFSIKVYSCKQSSFKS
jgi:hypothetical protein